MSTPFSFELIDLSYLELMADGDNDMRITLLEMLLEELPTEIEKMSNATATENWQELGEVSHKMKSTLAFVGNDEMTNANKELELLAKHSENPKRMATLMQQLEEKLTEVMPEIQSALKNAEEIG